MKKSWWYRFILLGVLSLLSILAVVPTLFNLEEDSPFPVTSKINLGLDLQGGLYMVLGIDIDQAFRDEITSYARRMESFLNRDEDIKARIGSLNDADSTDPRHSIIVEDPNQREEARENIRRIYSSFLRLTDEGSNHLEYGLTTMARTDLEKNSVTKSIEVIRNRIDEFGVTEPVILAQGDDRIVIQLPGVRDIERAKALIGQTAKLEFRLVDNSTTNLGPLLASAREAGIVYEQGKMRHSEYLSRLNNFLKDQLPEGTVVAFERSRGSGTEGSIPYIVEEAPRLTGDLLQDAGVQIDPQNNQPFVSLEFNSDGGRIFEEVTGENVGKQLAVMLDGNVYSAPNIQARIPGGRAQITLGQGGYNRLMQEARDLALILRAGALPVRLDFLEQRTVGPGLGQDSIEKARFAGPLGALLVFVFILFYYRFAGLLALGTLTLNILFVLASLVGLGATLTLPGIAGIALTVGMAVDANIIIYERIREEVRRGVGYYKAVENGFDQAFWTIIDANITTALAALCLFNFGTGPIRGFAVTLLIGIGATVYSSYFVGRLFFEFYMDRTEGQRLSI